MASRGSVIPLFVKQIKEGKPLTVTDPDMTRFMMSIDDAVDLVLYAFHHARAGRRVRPEGARRHDRDPGPGHEEGFPGRQSRQGHRHPARRETLRNAAHPRGNGQGRGLRRLLPRPGRHPRPQLRGVLLRGEVARSRRRRTTTRTTPAGSTWTKWRRCSAACTTSRTSWRTGGHDRAGHRRARGFVGRNLVEVLRRCAGRSNCASTSLGCPNNSFGTGLGQRGRGLSIWRA